MSKKKKRLNVKLVKGKNSTIVVTEKYFIQDSWCSTSQPNDKEIALDQATGQLGANIALSTAMDSEALCPQPPVLTTTLRGRKNHLCSQCPPEVQGLAPGHRE